MDQTDKPMLLNANLNLKLARKESQYGRFLIFIIVTSFSTIIYYNNYKSPKNVTQSASARWLVGDGFES